jgi:toxin YoeB
MRAIQFSPAAFRELEDWGRLDWRQQKILVLIQQVAREPFTGLGKPEPLRHQFSGCWSRRITEEHRLVYRVTEEAIVVVSCRHHY